MIQKTNDLSSGNYVKYFDYTADVCKLSAKTANFAIKMFLEQYDQHANFKLECPFKKVK